jgi:ABC-type transport system substrate-binding protein
VTNSSHGSWKSFRNWPLYEWTDPVTLVIHIRPGVTFHDGEILDAAAVKYTVSHGTRQRVA